MNRNTHSPMNHISINPTAAPRQPRTKTTGARALLAILLGRWRWFGRLFAPRTAVRFA